MTMLYRRLGTSGLKVSAISYGSWITFGKQFDLDHACKLMAAAYDAGVTFFDNAEGYEGGRSEEIMGEATARLGWRRDGYVVSSKVFWGKNPKDPRPTQEGLSRKHVVEACHAALRRLKVDYLDLYFAHRPDYDTPVLETVRAMSDLVTQGKVLYWGTSEWPAERIIEAHELATRWNLVAPTMEQPCYNLLARRRFEHEYKPLYQRYGMGTTIFSPLASGVLTGKYVDGIPAGTRLDLPGMDWLRNSIDPKGPVPGVVRDLVALARRLGTTPARLSLAWCLKNPNVSTAIIGATRLEQVEENLKALDALPLLTDQVMQEIETITAPTR